MPILLNEPPNTADTTEEQIKSLSAEVIAEVIKDELKQDLAVQDSNNQLLQNSDRGHDMVDNLGAGITAQVTGVSKGTDPVTEEIDDEAATSPFRLTPKPPM